MKIALNHLLSALLLAASTQVWSNEISTLEVEPIQALADVSTESAAFVISAVGDIMLDGTARPVLRERGYHYPFERVRTFFSGSAIVFGNLEGPLTDQGIPEPDKKYVFRSPPTQVSEALKHAGFTVVSLANNHMLDYGEDGLSQTISALNRVDIKHAGAGSNLRNARQPAFLQAKNQRVAILAYSMTFPENFYAGTNKAGTAFGHAAQVSADVLAARQQADIVLVSFHWGQEGKTELRDYQTRLGHIAIDAGADVVIGHHPHILQGIEQYKDGVILYSLGNFTFGSYSMNSARSAIAQLHFSDSRLQKIQMIPINVNNFEVQFQPQPLYGQAANEVISDLQAQSALLNTLVNNENGIGVVRLHRQASQR